jgi:AcrR family transcriptional regulator
VTVTASTGRRAAPPGEAPEHPRPDLVLAALAAITRDGPEVSMDRIAAEAGVTKPILYRHFGDKEGLVQAVAAHCRRRLMAALAEALTASATGREIMAATMDRYLRFIEEQPNVYRFLVRRSDRQHALEGFTGSVADLLATQFRTFLELQDADVAAAEPWAHGMVGMVHEAGDWWLGRRDMSRQQLVEHLTVLCWDGWVSTMPSAPPEESP